MTITKTIYFSNINTSDTRDEKEGETCVANISPPERQKRMRFGIMQFTISLAILVILVILDVNPLWRLLLFFMFSAATTSYIQALDKT